MIVLDTNVVSELMRPVPEPAVEDWVRRQGPRSLTTTAVTIGELRYGLARLPQGRRATLLRSAADDLLAPFADRVLPYDEAATTAYGAISADRERAGRPIAALDAQIAAICRSQGHALATRNIKDFIDTGIQLIDPWQV